MTNIEEVKETLQKFMYLMHHLPVSNDIYDLRNRPENMGIKSDNSKVNREKIIKALDWVNNNMDFDFKSFLSGLPYSNKEIYYYLMSWHEYYIKK
jgi:hypothetical protein